MLGVLVFDTLPGLVIGIVVSLLLLLYRASQPARRRARSGAGHRPASTPTSTATRTTRPLPGIAVLRVECGLFFANADAVRAAIGAHAAAPGTRAVVLDAETVPFIDVTAVRMLDELADDLAREGVRLVIAHDIGQVRDLLASEPDSTLALCIPASTKGSPASRPAR